MNSENCKCFNNCLHFRESRFIVGTGKLPLRGLALLCEHPLRRGKISFPLTEQLNSGIQGKITRIHSRFLFPLLPLSKGRSITYHIISDVLISCITGFQLSSICKGLLLLPMWLLMHTSAYPYRVAEAVFI